VREAQRLHFRKKSKSFTNLVGYGTDVTVGDMNLTISHEMPLFVSTKWLWKAVPNKRVVSAA
jgi:hypothetical protein